VNALEPAIYSYLAGVAGVTALTGTRIYPVQAPQSATLPYVVFHRISERRFPHLTASSGMVRTRVQVDVLAETMLSATAVGEQLRLALDGWRNTTMGDDSLNVLSVNLEDVNTARLEPTEGSNPGTYLASIDYSFLWAESIPTFA